MFIRNSKGERVSWPLKEIPVDEQFQNINIEEEEPGVADFYPYQSIICNCNWKLQFKTVNCKFVVGLDEEVFASPKPDLYREGLCEVLTALIVAVALLNVTNTHLHLSRAFSAP